MNKKQIILNYDEYLEMEEKIKDITVLLKRLYFKGIIPESFKNEIQELSIKYGWWL